jgi:hypothetical protein
VNPGKLVCLILAVSLFAVVPAKIAASSNSTEGEQTVTQHKEAAEARARRYFRYEYRVGSNSVWVTSLEIETNEPKLVEGWPGRYRTQGRAFLEFYDSKGRSFTRTTAGFEVLTEQKSREAVEVIDFTCK